MKMTKKISCCIGVTAYNEEANIQFLLESLLKQRLTTCRITKIIVVASGCTDNTEQIVRSLARKDNKITLVVQKKREGKASAINLFLSKADGEIAVIESGDTIPDEDTIENLINPFHDPKIGMTGAHPIPVNSDKTFMGFTAHLFWRLHHQLALQHPKLGELIAFRNIFKKIPKNTAVDEASIEAIITKAGYHIHYAKDAIVYNKGPETIKDFLKQRRRIAAGHKHLEKTQKYQVSTTKISNIFALFCQLLNTVSWNGKTVLWTCGAVFLELTGRLLGYFDYHIKKKNPFTWDIAHSTKNLKNDPMAGE